jgi:hypothetical protein
VGSAGDEGKTGNDQCDSALHDYSSKVNAGSSRCQSLDLAARVLAGGVVVTPRSAGSRARAGREIGGVKVANHQAKTRRPGGAIDTPNFDGRNAKSRSQNRSR